MTEYLPELEGHRAPDVSDTCRFPFDSRCHVFDLYLPSITADGPAPLIIQASVYCQSNPYGSPVVGVTPATGSLMYTEVKLSSGAELLNTRCSNPPLDLSVTPVLTTAFKLNTDVPIVILKFVDGVIRVAAGLVVI